VLETAFVGAGSFPVTYDDAQLGRTHHQFVEIIFPLITLPKGMPQILLK
jgi:hypothetical protein